MAESMQTLITEERIEDGSNSKKYDLGEFLETKKNDVTVSAGPFTQGPSAA